MTTFNVFPDSSDFPPIRRGGLNAEVLAAVEVWCVRYRKHNSIRIDTPLTHAQIQEILNDIRDVIYQHEGITKPKL